MTEINAVWEGVPEPLYGVGDRLCKAPKSKVDEGGY